MTQTVPGEVQKPWVSVISPRRGLLSVPWRELWAYRDLIWLMALRDVTATYKQTVLGPFWFVLQPLLTTATFSFLFGRMAHFKTNGLPHFVFYMTGLIIWNYFADCVNKISGVFTRNSQIFGKVYFPRLAAPLANMLSNLAPFAVQFTLLVIGIVYYFNTDPLSHIVPNWRIVVVPFLFLQTGMLAFGLGCIVAALTTRYKDLSLGVGFGLQLWMYGSSIIFPMSIVDPRWKWVFYVNPIVPIIEGVRFALMDKHGLVEKWQLGMSFGISFTIFVIGIMMFNRVEQTVIDTV